MTSIAKLKDKARKHEQNEDWRAAIQVYQRVLEHQERQDSLDQDLGLFNRIGDLNLRIGQVEEAVSYYETAAEKYAGMGFYNNAIALCNKALRHRPDRASVYLKLSRLYNEQGFQSDARRWILKYAERQLATGQVDEALGGLEAFAKLSDDPEVRELVADQLASHNHPEEAIDQLRSAYAIRARAGDMERAGQIARRARAIDPAADLAADVRASGMLDAPSATGTRDGRATTTDLPLVEPPPDGPVAPGEPDEEEDEAVVAGTEPPHDGALEDANDGEQPEGVGVAEESEDGLRPAEARPEPVPGLEPSRSHQAAAMDPETVRPETVGGLQHFTSATQGMAPGSATAGEDDDAAEAERAEAERAEAEQAEAERAEAEQAEAEWAEAERAEAERVEAERVEAERAEAERAEAERAEAERAEAERAEAERAEAERAEAERAEAERAEAERAEAERAEAERAEAERAEAERAEAERAEAERAEAERAEAERAEAERAEAGGAGAGPRGAADGPIRLDLSGAEPEEIGPPMVRETDKMEPLDLSLDTGLVDDLEPVEGGLDLDLGSLAIHGTGSGSASISAEDLDIEAVLSRSKELVSRGLMSEALRELRLLSESDAEPAAFREALAVVKEIIRHDPTDIAALRRRVQYAARTGDRELQVDGYLDLAEALERLGAESKAEAMYRRVLTLDPTNEVAREALGEPLVDEAEAEEAAEYAREDDGPAAGSPAGEPSSEAARESSPEAAEASSPSAGSGDPGEQRPAGVAEVLKQFRAKVRGGGGAAEDPGAHYDLGLAFKEMGLIDEAIAEYRVALTSGEDQLKVYEELGQCFALKGDHRMALKILDRALRVPTDDEAELLGVYYQMGQCHEALGRPDAARDAYRQVLAIDESFADVPDRMARL